MQTSDFNSWMDTVLELLIQIKERVKLPVFLYEYPPPKGIIISFEPEPPIMDDHSSTLKVAGSFLLKTPYKQPNPTPITEETIKTSPIVKLFETATQVQEILKLNSDKFNILDTEVNYYENDSTLGVEINFIQK